MKCSICGTEGTTCDHLRPSKGTDVISLIHRYGGWPRSELKNPTKGETHMETEPAPTEEKTDLAQKITALFEHERATVQHLLEGVRKDLAMFNVSTSKIDELDLILGFKARPALKPCLFYREETGKRCLESGEGLAAQHPEHLCENCREIVELAVQATKAQAKRSLDALKQDDRYDVMLNYCKDCGVATPPDCKCAHDE